MKTRSPALIVAALTFVIGLFMMATQSSHLMGVLFFAPFVLGPLVVSALAAYWISSRTSQLILLMSALLYSAWFVLAYLELFYWHLDPQNGIAFLLVGIYSLPVMIPLWIAAYIYRNRRSA